MKYNKIILFTILLIFIAAGVSFSQSRTGNLAGTVMDDKEDILPGVEVTITSPQMIAPSMSRITNANGAFRFHYLTPGTYTLKASLPGFKIYALENIIIKLGLTTDLEVKMSPASIEEEVTVISKAPIMSVKNTKLSTNVTADEIKQLPVNRSLNTIIDMAAGMQGTQALGSGSRENAYHVDGVQLTDPGSGTGLGASQSLDAYDEIQVETGGHAAEHGNASGAVVNVITKSGGNTYHGDVSFYFMNSKLQSQNHEGTGLSASSVETNYDYNANGSIGGPLIKDKIWFFASMGYDSYSRKVYLFPEDYTHTSYNPLVKLSIQPSVKHRINVSFNYNSRHTPYMYAGRYRTPEACFNMESSSTSIMANWLFSLNPSTIIEAMGAYLYRPTNYLARGRTVMVQDFATNMISGSTNDCLQERLRYQAWAAITKYVDNLAGDHEFKAGIAYERGESRNAINWFPDEYGMALYYRIAGQPYMAVSFDPPQSDPQIDPYDQYSAYIQNSWRINRFINLNIGVRLNYTDAYTPPQLLQTITLPIADWKTLEPRLALGIDPFGDGKTGIKVSVSRYDTMMWTWFYNLNPNGGSSTYYYDLGGGNFIPLFTSSGYNFEIDSDLKRPYVNELFVSVDRTLGQNFVIKASYIDRNFKDFVTIIDKNVTEEWYNPVQVINPQTGALETVYNLDYNAPDPLDFYNNDPRAKRHYKGFILELIKRMSHNFQFRLSYTWSSTKGTTGTSSSMMATGPWNDPNYNIRKYGEMGIAHVIKFHGIYMAPLGIVLSASYQGRSGYRYARFFQVYLNQGMQPFLTEDPGSRTYPFLHFLDIRVAKNFQIDTFKLSLFAELYNALNLNQTMSVNRQYNNAYYELDQIMDIQIPRIAQLGMRISF